MWYEVKEKEEVCASDLVCLKVIMIDLQVGLKDLTPRWILISEAKRSDASVCTWMIYE